jgi:cysteine desulfurase
MGKIYFDYNSSTPLDKRALEKMLPFLEDNYANPSAIYSVAQKAKNAIEDARVSLAGLLGAKYNEIIFTSGGTESNNTAIKGTIFCHYGAGGHIITSKIEHESVLNPCRFLEKQGFRLSYLNVDSTGVIDLKELAKSIQKDTILVSIMYANNEVGTIQPIKEIAKLCKEKGVYFHTDAVQAVGKIPIDAKTLGVDMLSLSAHKLYGPKGAGALYVREGVKIESLLHGGNHEFNVRAGTENTSGIVGLGEAARIAKEEMVAEEKKVRHLRDKLEQGIKEKIPQVKVNGHPKNRLYNTLNICIDQVQGENLLINLDFENICASGGSACASGAFEPSHVLLAMGIPREIARSSLRFSLGKYNTEEEVEKVLKVLPPMVKKLRRMSSSWNQDY